MSFLRCLIGSGKSRVCRNRYCDSNSDCSISVSTKGLLERWNENETGSHCKSSKRVVVVVDEGREAKVALLWALSHVLHNSHTLTLLHILDKHKLTRPRTHSHTGGLFWRNDKYVERNGDRGFSFVKSLEALCKSYCPDVPVEVVITEGNMTGTVVRWAKKLEASMVIVGQKKPSVFYRFFPRREEDMVEICIANAECVTVGVRKRSSRIGGYIINSRE
ncbi:hypothetical protein KI387_011784, partial [Taxus chinensis]